jgi:predicted Rossmann-fold nucleotide-binding protein
MSMTGAAPRHLVLAVFASDKGPGDAERASIMAQVGNYFAKRGAQIACLAEDDVLPSALITSARASGGEVQIIADEGSTMPAALADVPIERLSEASARLRRSVEVSDALVGLPGSLASVTSLFRAWSRGGGGTQGSKPVFLLNKNKAFEVLRGFTADVVSHSFREHDRKVQFSDNVEDLWYRISRAIGG